MVPSKGGARDWATCCTAGRVAPDWVGRRVGVVAGPSPPPGGYRSGVYAALSIILTCVSMGALGYVVWVVVNRQDRDGDGAGPAGTDSSG